MQERSLAWAFDAEGWEPPNPPSMENCGAGRGAMCCKFLVMGPEVECARFTDLHPTLAGTAMGSAFMPETADCQAERAAADTE